MLLLSCLYYNFKWKCFFYRLCMLGLVVVDYFMMIFKCCILKKRWLFVVVVDWEDLSYIYCYMQSGLVFGDDVVIEW